MDMQSMGVCCHMLAAHWCPTANLVEKLLSSEVSKSLESQSALDTLF